MNGYAMAYDIEGEGIPLLFIHQVATDRRLWHHQRGPFCRRYRLITVDIMGHSQVSWPSEEFSLERTASHVEALLERLKVGPVFLTGVSMGSAVALRVALRNPVLVRGLILISPWSHTSEHTRSLVERIFRLAEAGDADPYRSFSALRSSPCIPNVLEYPRIVYTDLDKSICNDQRETFSRSTQKSMRGAAFDDVSHGK
jgi:pimeloyl-ACP methyl ester carboxylesterase